MPPSGVHPKLRDLSVRDLRDPLQVVPGSGAQVAKSDQLGDPPTQQHAQAILQLLRGGQAVLLGQILRVPQRGHTPWDDRDLHHRIAVLQEPPHNGMAGLVVGHDLLLKRREHSAAALDSPDHAIHRGLQVSQADLSGLIAGRNQRTLVADICDVCPDEAGSEMGHALRKAVKYQQVIGGLHVGRHGGLQLLWGGVRGGLLAREKLVHLIPAALSDLLGPLLRGLVHGLPGLQLQRAEVQLEDQDALLDLRPGDVDLPVKTSWSQQSRVQLVRTDVGAGQNNDLPGLLGKAVHLHQQGVQRVLALVVGPAHDTPASGAANRVNLIDVDDRALLLAGLLEQRADPRRTHPDVHLNEVRPTRAEEGHITLPGGGLCEQGLPRSRGAHQNRSIGDLRAKLGETVRLLQKANKLHDLLLGLVHSGNVLELGADLRRCHCVELPQVPWAAPSAAATLHLGPGLGHGAQDRENHRDVQQGGNVLQQLIRLGLPYKLEVEPLRGGDAEVLIDLL
eukprot:RCo018116